MKSTRAYYEDLSQRYDVQRSNPYFRLIEQLELEVLRRHIGSTEERLLEIGCGTGIFLKHLQSYDVSLHGLDYAAGMLQVARRELDLRVVVLVEGDGQTLPYADGSFDTVYSFKVLAHLPRTDCALREIRRVLRPGGVAILEFYNRHSIRYLLHRGGYFHQWQSPREVWAQVQEAGLQVVHTYGARIVTPFAQALRIPVVAQILRYIEKRLAATILNSFAGYYTVVCRPQSGCRYG
jgi:ubiquinone/menaquinone biosynthesis C-methylase UbiE